jgi:hypothetical protein
VHPVFPRRPFKHCIPLWVSRAFEITVPETLRVNITVPKNWRQKHLERILLNRSTSSSSSLSLCLQVCEDVCKVTLYTRNIS